MREGKLRITRISCFAGAYVADGEEGEDGIATDGAEGADYAEGEDGIATDGADFLLRRRICRGWRGGRGWDSYGWRGFPASQAHVSADERRERGRSGRRQCGGSGGEVLKFGGSKVLKFGAGACTEPPRPPRQHKLTVQRNEGWGDAVPASRSDGEMERWSVQGPKARPIPV